MLIVDSQIHIWENGLPTNPAHRQIPVYSQDDALRDMDAASVDAAALHPPGWDPQANEIAVEAARQHPNRFAILGNFPVDRLESRALVERWKQRPLTEHDKELTMGRALCQWIGWQLPG